MNGAMFEETPNASLKELKAAIARYARDHPDACDTLEGIRAWWLRHLRGASERVLEALIELEREGVMMRRLVSGGTEMWSTAPRNPRA